MIASHVELQITQSANQAPITQRDARPDEDLIGTSDVTVFMNDRVVLNEYLRGKARMF